MSGLEDLATMIYHERQQSGSMLCAQHALNSLLQGNYFTAIDLADIAQRFDALEREALGDEALPNSSGNMDDTGFFSVQVMDKALDVWGLDLIRWRSPQMRPYSDVPHKQLAFVLNLHQHWFTLRRFGPATSNFERDSGEGVWFNLNSQYTKPRWVSKTYLGMFLQQCEEEGYSVFAVVQHDRTQPLSLPRTEADQAAALVEAPDSLPDHSSNTMPGSFPGSSDNASNEREQIVIPDDIDYDVNNEDVELQAALAASLAGTDAHSSSETAFGQHSYVPQVLVPEPSLHQALEPPSTSAEYPAGTSMDIDESADPIAASAARNRALLEQMQRMQEEALREGFGDEQGASNAERRRAREEEDELQRAIRESMKDQENVESSVPASEQDKDEEIARVLTGNHDRVYDDEDAELQAALRASLEEMPEGFVHVTPPSEPAPSRQQAPPASEVSTHSDPRPRAEATQSGESMETEAGTEEDGAPLPPAVDRDEMRRARLARFGG